MGKFGCGRTLFKMSWSIQLATPKTLSREARYKSRKIRESLEIKRSKYDSIKLNINRDDGNFVKTNTWTLLRNNRFDFNLTKKF